MIEDRIATFDKDGNPEVNHILIGRKHAFTLSKSDGSLQMQRWAESNNLKSFKLYVHHTDSVREWTYDRDSHIGSLDKGSDETQEKVLTVIDMKKDWKIICHLKWKKNSCFTIW